MRLLGVEEVTEYFLPTQSENFLVKLVLSLLRLNKHYGQDDFQLNYVYSMSKQFHIKLN